MSREIIIGSRGSDLALWQANHIKDKLEKNGHSVRIEIIKTQGDIIQHLSFDKMEGKGFFTKELENALREKRIDMAVHSYKDLETTQPDDLSIAAVSSRANPADLMLISKEFYDPTERWSLRKGSKVGTSSARRKMQLVMHRPDVEIDDIRGNVPTRINKLREGHFDAIILAHAGPARLKLDLSEFARHDFDPTEFIPAPAQGVLACQCRTADEDLRHALGKIHNKSANRLVATERKVLNLFHGGCQMPLGAYCIETEEGIELRAVMAPDWREKPSIISLQSDTTEGLAEKAVDGLKKKATA